MSSIANLMSDIWANYDALKAASNIADMLNVSVNEKKTVAVDGKKYHPVWQVVNHWDMMKKLGLGAEISFDNQSAFYTPVRYITEKGEETYAKLKKEGFYEGRY